jgi:hypothetical protein
MQKVVFLGDLESMRRLFLLFFVTLTLCMSACSPKSGSTTSVVKPKYHHRWYDRKKDRHTKRTKTIRMKS